MENISFVNSIKWHRENFNMKAKSVAFQIGITAPIYSKIENGKRAITLTEFRKIADLFEMSMDELSVIPLRKEK